MDSNLIAFAGADKPRVDNQPISSNERIIDFYREASLDYGHWSRDFNMHMGFYRRSLNPFAREKMLEQFNLEIAARLHLDAEAAAVLIDLGCGAGAISRTVARQFPLARIKGVTISPLQVAMAIKLNAKENLEKRIEITRGDYTKLAARGGAADGVWAVESACYADGAAKENLLSEMARVLKSGGRFVVADCFIKQPEKKIGALMEKCYAGLCRNWAFSELPALDCFVAALQRKGFRDITVEDISWRVAPSMAHAPFAVFTFLLKKLFAGEPLKPQSVSNLKASLLALAIGLNRSRFSYCLISGTRG